MASNVEGIRCPKCSKTFDSRPAMEAHQRDAHGPRRSLPSSVTHPSIGPSTATQKKVDTPLTGPLTQFECICGKKFQDETQLQQHRLAKSSKKFCCDLCCESYDSTQTLGDHRNKKHRTGDAFGKPSSKGISDEAKGHEDRTWKCACGKTFVNEDQLTQHRVAKKENAKPFQCPQCCHSYENQERLDAHKLSQHADLVLNGGSASPIVRTISSDGSSLRNQPMLPTGNKTYRCLQCIRPFPSSDALIAHEKAMNHDNSDIRGNKQKSLQRYLENYYRMKSEVNPDDKDTSFEFVRNNVLQILANVRKQEGGRIFKCELRNAGSNATELKIGKADEFDFNIPIDVKVLEVKREGTVPYIFKDKERKKTGEGPSSKNMNVKRELYYDPGGKFPIPKDYAVLVVDKSGSPTLNDLCVENHLIPHHLQQKLHSCIREALKGMDAIDLNAEAHGPAITMNMHPPDDHHISVDLTMIIDWKHITVKEYGWPRPETQKNLSRKLIDIILAAGCQLTPKGDEFWNISFSNCESILMKEVDGPSECRKMCHKLLKSFFQTWRSRSKTGYKTISSFIFKHLTFWMNENYPQPGYWNKSNLSVCFLDTLRELLKSLNSKKLVNYFIPNENIMGIRDVDEVNELAGEVKKEIRELENINC